MRGRWQERRRVELTHYGGLDGLRGIAVVAVLLYHGGVSWAPGGFLGVEVFFVLSGFLITSLLVAEWGRSSTVALGAFWARRARRLLPALFALVSVIGVYYAIAGPTKAIPGLQGDGIATLLYYSNWHQIAAGTNYFAASGPVSPLQHTWSLAIEEQFYILWPLALLGVLWLMGRRAGNSPRRSLQVLLGVSLTAAAGAATEMALLFDGGRGLNRVYYGTDTRAASLLIGGALAIALDLRRQRQTEVPNQREAGDWGARALGGAAVLALLAVLLTMRYVSGSMGWLYPYGLVALDGAVVVMILAVVRAPGSVTGRVLSLWPLRALGQISYGLYLWHFPLFLWLDTASTGVSGTRLLVLRMAVTLAVSVVSFVVVEQPIRQRRRPTWLVRASAPLAAGGAVASLLLASAAGGLPVGVPAAATLPQPPPKLRGSDPACQETLTDTPQYGLAPVAAGKEAQFEYSTLGYSRLTWSGSSQKTFQTCPPKKVMVVGDSLAFTLGVPMLSDEQHYGVEVANAAMLGCAFTGQGELNVNGTWEAPPAGCRTALQQWERDEKTLRPQEVVVELGYRDEFDWRFNGKVEHLGEPTFDAYVQSQISRYVKVLGRGGVKVLLLTVPYTHPPDLPDGSPAPAASGARHALINSMLRAAARRDPQRVAVLDLDQTVSPGNHYNAKVNGQLCRFDGIHFSVYCGELLEPRILGTVRSMIG